MAGPEPDEKSAVHSDVKSHLRNLLDAKEKQLQQAGTLGQRVLAQQMELEERIRQLQEDIEDESGGKSGVGSDAMEKLKDLADTLDQWERENTVLTSGFGKVGIVHEHEIQRYLIILNLD
jgi:ferritin-like metal-binding protein YciE